MSYNPLLIKMGLRFVKMNARVLWGITVCIFLSACGYRLSGGGNFPESIRSICIPVFENKSTETGLENRITNDLIYEVSGYKTIALLDAERADAVLSGVISAQINTVSRKGNTPLEKRIVVSVDVTLTSQGKGVIWSAKGISADETYYLKDKIEDTQQRKDTALALLSKRLAEDIYNRLTSGF